MSLDQQVRPSPAQLAVDLERRDVALVRWPTQRRLRSRLERDGRPRLLLVPASSPPPTCVDELEDWMRAPFEPAELELRTQTLRRRAQRRALRPRVDDSGLVWSGERWVHLPRAQLAIARLLVARFGRLVSSDAIRAEYLAGGGSGHPKALRAAMGRIKHRLAELDVHLATVRDRGYMLDSTALNAVSPRDAE